MSRAPILHVPGAGQKRLTVKNPELPCYDGDEVMGLTRPYQLAEPRLC